MAVSDTMRKSWEIKKGLHKYKREKRCKKCGGQYFYKTGNCVQCKKKRQMEKLDKKYELKNGRTVKERKHIRLAIEESQIKNKNHDDGYETDF